MSNVHLISLMVIAASAGVLLTYGGTDDFYTTEKATVIGDDPGECDVDPGEDVVWTEAGSPYDVQCVPLTILAGGSLTIESGATVWLYDYAADPAESYIKLQANSMTNRPELIIEDDATITARDGIDGDTTYDIDDWGGGIYAITTNDPAYIKIGAATITGQGSTDIPGPIGNNPTALESDGPSEIEIDGAFFSDTILIDNLDDSSSGGYFKMQDTTMVADPLYFPVPGVTFGVVMRYSYMDPSRVQIWGNHFEDHFVAASFIENGAPFSTDMNFFHNKMLGNQFDFAFGPDPGPITIGSVVGFTVDEVTITEQMGNYWSDYDEVSEGCVDTDRDGICDDLFDETVDPGAIVNAVDPAPFTDYCLCQVPSIYYEISSPQGSGNIIPFTTVPNDTITFTPTLLPGYKAQLEGLATTNTQVEWDFDDDGTPEITKMITEISDPVTHLYPDDGNRFCVATVTDDEDQESDPAEDFGLITSPTRDIHIIDGPTAIITGLTAHEFHQLVELELDGSKSSSPNPTPPTPMDPNIDEYRWTVVKDLATVDTGDEVSFSWTPTEFGTYTITLNVTDEESYWDEQIEIIDFIDDPPVADIGASLSSTPPMNHTPTLAVTEGDRIKFWSLSTDPQDNIMLWLWEWDDGSADDTSEITNHTYDDPGTYEVTLTVEDASGNSDSINMTVKVKEKEEEDRVQEITSFILGPLLIGVIVAVVIMYLAYKYDESTFAWPSAEIAAVGLATAAIIILVDSFMFDIAFVFGG